MHRAVEIPDFNAPARQPQSIRNGNQWINTQLPHLSDIPGSSKGLPKEKGCQDGQKRPLKISHLLLQQFCLLVV